LQVLNAAYIETHFSMVHVQKKIAVGMDVLKFFTMNNWNFKSDNFQSLLKKQSKEEHDMFLIDTENVGDTVEYLKTSLYGGRQYCARDPLSTIPKAKIIYKM
jgi:alcohol-forming fatty acyl-CoA reductase